MLSGCKRDTGDGIARLSILCNEPVSRATVSPNVTLSALENFVLRAKLESEEEYTTLAEFSNYEELSGAKILIAQGTYVFELTTNKNGTRFFSKTDATQITSGDNIISFTLNILEYGTDSAGSARVKVNFPQEVAAVRAALLTFPEKNTVSGFETEDLQISENSVTYQKQEIPSGTYFLVFKLYKDESNTVLLKSETDILTIASGFESIHEQTVTDLQKPYSVNYELLGGSFVPGITYGTSYTSLSEYNLVEDTNVYKPGYDFSGWYLNSDYSGEPVTKIEKGSQGNKSVYAKWTPKTDTAYAVNYYIQNIDDDEYTIGTELSQTCYGTTDTYTEYTPQVLTGFTLNPFNDEIISGNGNTEINLYYKRNVVTLIFNLDGGQTETAFNEGSIVAKYGASFTVANPTKTGYTFTGWNTQGFLPATIPEENTIYKALWTANTYTVTLHNQGATTAGTTSVTATYGTWLPAITVPAKTGYTFGGYYTGTGGSGTQYITASGASARNWDIASATHLYAKWTANMYTVTLNNQSAATAGTASLTATYGSAVPSITVPAKTGYTFGGYYTGTGGSGTQYITASGASARNWDITSATTLYAKWTPNTYTITYTLNGGTHSSGFPTTHTYGTATTLKSATRTGYTFNGWYTASDYSGSAVSTLDATAYTTNISLYAKWTGNTYTVTLNNQSAATAGTASVTATYGSAVPSITVPEKTGYTFAGYYTGTNGSGTQYISASGTSAKDWDIASATTLYAKWTPNTYTFRFNANGGSGTMADQVVAYDEETYLNPCSFTKTGYHFVYWSLTPGGANAYIDGHEIYNETTENNAIINLYANYAINTYKIKFAYNSGVNTQYITGSLPSQMTCTYGQSYTLPANNIFRCGDTANGWNRASSGTGGTHYESGATVSNLTATHGATVILYTEWLSGHIVSVSELDDLFDKLEMLSYPSCVTIRITDTNPDMMWVRLKPQEHSSVKFGYDLTQCTDITSFGTMEGTTNLYYCYLPDTVTRITSWCFQDCTNLASVTISSNVREIGQGCFLNASGLLYIEFEDPSFWYKTDNRTDWENHTNGSPVDFSDEEANCSILNNYTWYYYKNHINQLPAGTDGTAGTSATYVEFGEWPQTIKAANVTVNETETKVMGANTYYKGSDGAWYAKCLENAYNREYVYSDGTEFALPGENPYKYFKVEPIKWRVLTTDYNGTGKALLLAENALMANVLYLPDNVSIRTISGNDVYFNNYKYSTIRAYLNGSYEADDTQTRTYAGKGFLQTAFTNELQALIATTTVDNSARSTNTDRNASEWNSGVNDYACANTADKIFLLSEQEVTASGYGFSQTVVELPAYISRNEYNCIDASNRRIRFPTDYGLANFCYKSRYDSSYGSWWWLRSPSYDDAGLVRVVYCNGNVGEGGDYYSSVSNLYGGIVPALCITLP